jgi:ABC-type polysaccharide/polyol phosphate transport system ATPase subunit
MNGPALRLDGVSRRYSLAGPEGQLKTTVLHPVAAWRKRRQHAHIWAVRDVTLEVARGEFFSVIGANGSGKSTLLRLVSGLSQPTAGAVTVNGRLSTLLELGTGFHPNVTGRENAIINGLLMGMRRGEMEDLLPQIVEFAGLQEFIDQPMRTYSTGMYVRLGFAIAAYMEPELLVIDEVLAVGDGVFQQKCYAYITGLREKGVTIVMVSHDLASVEHFSSRVGLMEQGRMISVGDPHAIVEEHLDRLSASSPEIRRSIEEGIEKAIANDPQARANFERLVAEKKARKRGEGGE